MGLFKKSKSLAKPKSSPSTSTSTYETQQRNISTSNLSTTSTLIPTTTSSRPNKPTRTTSYEAFLSHAEENEAKWQEKLEKEERMARAWAAAQQRREAGRGGDPWRGGFGPPAVGTQPQGVRDWLGQNGLV
jgi:hypothetical protein